MNVINQINNIGGCLCRVCGRLWKAFCLWPAATIGRMPRVLLIKTSSMGDVIHCLPAATDMQRHIPRSSAGLGG